MAVSLDSSSPSPLNKELRLSMNSSPLFCPDSDKRFWSSLRSRVDSLLDNRKLETGHGRQILSDLDLPIKDPAGFQDSEPGKRLREDCLLLLKGFDSISSSLSQLTSNIDTALQGARELAKPSIMEAMQGDLGKPEAEEEEEEEEDSDGKKRGVKRKCNVHDPSDSEKSIEEKENEESSKAGKMKKAKNLAVSMADKAAWLARELKSIKSDLCFMQERCGLLEEENRRLREGYGKGDRPDEDDLVRLQLEALLAEKSRLATENANLTRENQCLRQLVEYHQFTAQDLSASYEQLMQGIHLDFSSPTTTEAVADEARSSRNIENKDPRTTRTDLFGFSASLDGNNGDDEHYY